MWPLGHVGIPPPPLAGSRSYRAGQEGQDCPAPPGGSRQRPPICRILGSCGAGGRVVSLCGCNSFLEDLDAAYLSAWPHVLPQAAEVVLAPTPGTSQRCWRINSTVSCPLFISGLCSLGLGPGKESPPRPRKAPCLGGGVGGRCVTILPPTILRPSVRRQLRICVLCELRFFWSFPQSPFLM